ncbi:MAG: hypothetical protein JWP34_5307 [Massilia sp.]|nr:hypothetical protein [Massilia sp.]
MVEIDIDIDIETLVLQRRERIIDRQKERVQQQVDTFHQQQVKLASQHKDAMDSLDYRARKRSELIDFEERRYRKDVKCVLEQLKEYSPNLVAIWLKYDAWSIQEALALLLGFDPKSVRFNEDGLVLEIPLDKYNETFEFNLVTLDDLHFDDPAFQDVVGITEVIRMYNFFKHKYTLLMNIWNSGSHGDQRRDPGYYINWLLSKGMGIKWLDFAIENGWESIDEKRTNLLPVSVEGEVDKLDPRSESAYINIVGALCDLYWKSVHPGDDYAQVTLLKALEVYEGYYGLSERNLKDKLPKAIKAIGLG